MNQHQPTTVLVTGPESSGKSTLARELAWTLDGILVPEAARDYLSIRGGNYGPEDLPKIWKAQRTAEDKARRTNASYVICDTGPEVIRIWAGVKYGLDIPEVTAANQQRNYDIILLCYPDIPWVPDPLREAPEQWQREALFDEYHQLFTGRKNVLISGNNRLETALKAIEDYPEKIPGKKFCADVNGQPPRPAEVSSRHLRPRLITREH